MGGLTLSELVKEYPFEHREEINVVPLVGGIGTKHIEIHANQLAYELAKKCKEQVHTCMPQPL
ncbi:hypothetical protein GCM10020331_013190 [Ectobacillus funiculus]